jgi:hypothetical protein
LKHPLVGLFCYGSTFAYSADHNLYKVDWETKAETVVGKSTFGKLIKFNGDGTRFN